MIDIITLNHFVEWIIVILVLLYTFRNQQKLAPAKELNHGEFVFIIFVGIFLIILFGFRDYKSVMAGDSWLYEYSYQNAVPWSDCAEFNYTGEWLWKLIMSICRELGFSSSEWFVLIACIYIVPVIIGCRLISPNSPLTPFVFFVASFLFMSNGMNGIRNADACSLAFLGICILMQSQRIKTLFFISPLLIAAYCIHQSTIMLTIPLLLSFFLIKSTKTAVLLWFIAIILSLALGNSVAHVVAAFSENDKAMGYLSGGENDHIMQAFSKRGFRWDFLLYSALPIIIGWIVTVKFNIVDKSYQLLLNTYILSNAVWVIFIYAAFSNRFAMLSWFIYPFVLAYPFTQMHISPKQLAYSKTVLWIEYGTTIFLKYL